MKYDEFRKAPSGAARAVRELGGVIGTDVLLEQGRRPTGKA
ncbi:hypothetical protein [Kitasatospora sp. NPDC017646]